MPVDFLTERFDRWGDCPAVVAGDKRCSFDGLAALRRRWDEELERANVVSGTVVGLEGEFSPNAIALFLALVDRRAIVAPHSNADRMGRDRKDDLAQLERYCRVDADDRVRVEETGRVAAHRLYDVLRERDHPGLVLFSSGSAGEPKAAVHDFTFLLEKFRVRRPALSTLAFLSFDHLGGLNTMLHSLSNCATVVAVPDRSPEAVCGSIEEHRVELLPATPTFFNLLLLSGAHRRHDLSSLRVISYGAEPMPEHTLTRLRDAFPKVKLQQTYGLVEVGALRSKSRDDGSLWVKVGGEGYETRVVDGMLEIRTAAMILGYLNAPTPVTPDGWFMTGDAVLQDGEYLRFLGRRSELINVGGEKVYPAEVESVIQSMGEVEEVSVYGEPNRLVGEIVCARVKPRGPVDPVEFAGAVKRFCRDRLDRFKVPVKVSLTDQSQTGPRFKKIRR